MSQDEKGNDLLKQAEKRLKAFSLFGSGSKYEDAADLFAKAANVFKAGKNWKAAGDAFTRQAEMFTKTGSKHEAASAYTDAASCFKKVSVNDAVNCLKQAVDIFIDMGSWTQAAKFQKEIGELYESEEQLENAIDAFQVAADYYSGEDQMSAANQCLLKIAQYSAQLENYKKAIQVYEQVAKQALDNNLLKWSAKDYFFRAGLCHLASGELEAAKRAVERYEQMDMGFSGTREQELLNHLAEAVEQRDLEEFTNRVYDYDQISKLDAWKTTILLRIKEGMTKDTVL
eukprot:tig00021463_g21628.t1